MYIPTTFLFQFQRCGGQSLCPRVRAALSACNDRPVTQNELTTDRNRHMRKKQYYLGVPSRKDALQRRRFNQGKDKHCHIGRAIYKWPMAVVICARSASVQLSEKATVREDSPDDEMVSTMLRCMCCPSMMSSGEKSPMGWQPSQYQYSDTEERDNLP